ncbi:MAG: 50S ribosomal protein L39e [Candidatus Woesearchaeota archaeon]
MATNKHVSKKLRMIKKGRQTRWAPFWTVLKAYNNNKKVHPGRHTEVKRSWKRTNMKV